MIVKHLLFGMAAGSIAAVATWFGTGSFLLALFVYSASASALVFMTAAICYLVSYEVPEEAPSRDARQNPGLRTPAE